MLFAGSSTVAQGQKILPPDLDRIESQVRVVSQTYERRFGEEFPSGTKRIAALQRMLNEKVFRKDETYKLQSMGVALGQILAEAGSLQWVTVSDEYGDDPALRYRRTSVLVFPLTMISKRVERDEEVDVEYLYEHTLSIVRELEAKDQ